MVEQAINPIVGNSDQIFPCPICGVQTGLVETRLGRYDIYRCPICIHRFAPGAFGDTVDYSAIYDTDEYKTTQEQDLKRLRENPRLFALHATYKPFFDHIKHHPNMRLLDVGCGVGRFCQAAHSLGWNVTGIDVSKKAISVAKQYARFPVYCLKLDEFSWQGERFDVVTAFEVLEHLPDPVDFLQRCRKLLSDRGQIFCTVPNWDCDLVQTATRMDWVPPVHLNFFTRSSLSTAVVNAEFEVVKANLIWTDPLPARLLPTARWIMRRLKRTARHPLGIWIHAKM